MLTDSRAKAGRQTNQKTGIHTKMQTHRIVRQIDSRKRDKQTDKNAVTQNRQADRQKKERQKYRQK